MRLVIVTLEMVKNNNVSQSIQQVKRSKLTAMTLMTSTNSIRVKIVIRALRMRNRIQRCLSSQINSCSTKRERVLRH